MILGDRKQTIDICKIVGLSYGTHRQILSQELNMKRIAAEFVPQMLSSKKRALHKCLQWTERTASNWPIYFLTSSQMMKVGITDMTMKLFSNHPSERKPVKSRATSNPYWSLSLILMELYPSSSCPLVRQLIENSIVLL